MLHRRRLAALALAVALVAVPTATATAYAADPPIVGSIGCDAVVDADQLVVDARVDLAEQEAALAALNLELADATELTDAQQAQLDAVVADVAQARVALTGVIGNAAARLCVALPTGEPTTTVPTPAPEPTPTTTAPPAVEFPATPVPTATSGAPTTTVDPIADDGTTAATGGTQVRIVPEGSADTGDQ